MEGFFERICSQTTLMEAWKRVRAKGASGGLDGVSVASFESELVQNLSRLRDDLLSNRYTPQPLTRHNSPKMDGSGECRPLSLPCVVDKVVQQSVKTVIEPLFEAVFPDTSYAYRPGKGPRKAFKRVHHFLTTGKCRWVALADFDRFFDTLDQDRLIHALAEVCDDPDVIKLIRMWIRIGYVGAASDYHDVTAGVGQGSVISPLLSNIYVHPLDRYMRRQGHHTYLRYSDNMLAAAPDRAGAERALRDLTEFSRDSLGLTLNQDSTPIRNLGKGFVFLGIYYRGERRAIDFGKIKKIRGRLKHLLDRHKTPDMLLKKLNETLGGFKAYYGILAPEEQFTEIDGYVQRILSPVLADFVRKGHYRNIDELLMFLSSIRFLSETFERDRSERLRDLAGEALRALVGKKQQKKKPKAKVTNSVKAADRAVSGRKRQYRKTQMLTSELVVSTYGAFVGKSAERVVVKSRGKQLMSHRLDQLKTIVVACKGVTFSSDLIHACSDRKIAVAFLARDGEPYAMLDFPSHPQARLSMAQLKAMENEYGKRIAKRIVSGKIRNQLNLAKFYGRSRRDDELYVKRLEEMDRQIDQLLEKADSLSETMQTEDFRNQLLSVEARGAICYWGILKQLIHEDVAFPGRKRKGAQDLVNSMLNYGYGILYNRIRRAVALAGLNPCLSFLHSPQHGKPTLVFDLIEEFRCQCVDRPVFTMLTRGEAVAQESENGLLTEDTRKKVITNVLERLASTVPYRGKSIRLDEVIRLQPGHLAACLEKHKPYRPFIGRY